jgi:hypothetical protein
MVSAKSKLVGGLKYGSWSVASMRYKKGALDLGGSDLNCHAEVITCALLTANQPSTFYHRMQASSDYLFTMSEYLIAV